MQSSKRICIAFLGNAHHDSRVTNLTNSLRADGFDVSVISFDWSNSEIDNRDGKIKVIGITGKERSSLLFYSGFAIKLIRELIRANADIFFAEDFYTLPFVTLIAKIKGAKVYYNSRELYAFIGGLHSRPFLQAVIKRIEKFFITKVDLVMTTGEMDSGFIEKFYGIKNTLVIRNIPLFQKTSAPVDYRKMFGIPKEHLILLYQGIIIGGRGIPVIFDAMKKIPETSLVLLGGGEQKINYKNLAEEMGIASRVFFAGTIPQKELINYTAGADAGLSLIENISISYYHALPNKLFEYIMAGLPVLSSNLPQMKKIVEDFKVGEVVDIEQKEQIVDAIQRWIDNPGILNGYKKNTRAAAEILNWQEEYKRAFKKLFPER